MENEQGIIQSPFLHSIEKFENTNDSQVQVSHDNEVPHHPFLDNLISLEDNSSDKAQAFVFMNELHDYEFPEMLHELSLDLETEIDMDSLSNQEASEFFQSEFNQLDHGFNYMLQKFEHIDLNTINDHELDAIIEDAFLNDLEEIEESEMLEFGLRSRMKRRRSKRKAKRKKFFKKIKQKAKKVIKKVKKLGKAVVKRMLKKLKKHAKKLLIMALKRSMNKIPTAYRKPAKMILGKLLKKEITYQVELEELQFDPFIQMQYELDIALANELYHFTDMPEREENFVISDIHFNNHLEEAREQFANNLINDPEDQELGPHVEEFVVAIIKTIQLIAKPIIAAIGRDKVVEALAKPIAKLVSKFTKRKKIRQILPPILADLGLRAMKLEIEEGESEHISTYTISNMVESMVYDMLDHGVHVFEDQELFSEQLLASFENAIIDNFPPILDEEVYKAKPSLRQIKKNAWRTIKGKKRKLRYKKALRKLRKRLNKRVLKKLKGFKNRPLSQYLSSAMDLPGAELDLEIQLFESRPGTSAFDIIDNESSHYENMESDDKLILHPLTHEVASILFENPSLSDRETKHQLHSERCSSCSKKYFAVKTVQDHQFPTLNRSSLITHCYMTIDLINNNVGLSFYLDEIMCRELSDSKINQLTKVLLSEVDEIFRNYCFTKIKVVHTNVIPGQLSGIALTRLPLYVLNELKQYLKNHITQFVASSMSKIKPALRSSLHDNLNGITIDFEFRNIPDREVLSKLLANASVEIGPVLFKYPMEAHSLEIKPGR